MNWRDHIHTDPAILSGKSVVQGTRLSVGFLLGLFAEGWTSKQVLDSYPVLTKEALQAVFAFAAESAREERLSSPATRGE
jgi:CRISPR-associated Cas5-like protein